MIEPLTPRLKEVLDFIVNYVKKRGYFPTYREISPSPGNAVRLVDALVARGYLKRMGVNRARSFSLLYNPDSSPNWEGIAQALKEENTLLRQWVHSAGIVPPPKSVDY